MVSLAFVDVESCRLGSEQGSALWELAIIAREPAGDVEYLWQIRPSLEHAEANALRIGGYYERCKVADRPVGSGMILSHPKYKGKHQAMAAVGIAREVARLLDGALIVGANPWFDAGHIDVFLREYGQALSADYHMRDISSVVAGYRAGQSREIRNAIFCKAFPADMPVPAPLATSKLTEVARALGFNPDSYKTHTALGDARLARDIWNAVFA